MAEFVPLVDKLCGFIAAFVPSKLRIPDDLLHLIHLRITRFMKFLYSWLRFCFNIDENTISNMTALFMHDSLRTICTIVDELWGTRPFPKDYINCSSTRIYVIGVTCD